MKGKLSPPLLMPPPLKSKRPNHQSVQVPPSQKSGSDKLTRTYQLEYCRGTSETLSSEQEFPQPCRDVDRLDLCGCVTISVPENNLKYTKFSGKYKIYKRKINKLIGTVRTEKCLPPKPIPPYQKKLIPLNSLTWSS